MSGIDQIKQQETTEFIDSAKKVLESLNSLNQNETKELADKSNEGLRKIADNLYKRLLESFSSKKETITPEQAEVIIKGEKVLDGYDIDLSKLTPQDKINRAGQILTNYENSKKLDARQGQNVSWEKDGKNYAYTVDIQGSFGDNNTELTNAINNINNQTIKDYLNIQLQSQKINNLMNIAWKSGDKQLQQEVEARNHSIWQEKFNLQKELINNEQTMKIFLDFAKNNFSNGKNENTAEKYIVCKTINGLLSKVGQGNMFRYDDIDYNNGIDFKTGAISKPTYKTENMQLSEQNGNLVVKNKITSQEFVFGENVAKEAKEKQESEQRISAFGRAYRELYKDQFGLTDDRQERELQHKQMLQNVFEDMFEGLSDQELTAIKNKYDGDKNSFDTYFNKQSIFTLMREQAKQYESHGNGSFGGMIGDSLQSYFENSKYKDQLQGVDFSDGRCSLKAVGEKGKETFEITTADHKITVDKNGVLQVSLYTPIRNFDDGKINDLQQTVVANKQKIQSGDYSDIQQSVTETFGSSNNYEFKRAMDKINNPENNTINLNNLGLTTDQLGLLTPFIEEKTKELSGSADNPVGVSLTDNRIEEVPKGLLSLSNVQRLNLSDNMISKVPDNLDQNNEKLTHLHLSGNNLKEIPKVLENMTTLQGLQINGNRLSDIGDTNRIKNLTELGVGHNKISNISDEVKNLGNLKDFWIAENDLKGNIDVSEMKSLKYLNMQGNELQEISGLAGLTGLEDIDLSDNQISKIDENLSNLDKLKYLDLQENSFSVLPNIPYQEMDAIMKVRLQENSIATIGENINKDIIKLDDYNYKQTGQDVKYTYFDGYLTNMGYKIDDKNTNQDPNSFFENNGDYQHSCTQADSYDNAIAEAKKNLGIKDNEEYFTTKKELPGGKVAIVMFRKTT